MDVDFHPQGDKETQDSYEQGDQALRDDDHEGNGDGGENVSKCKEFGECIFGIEEIELRDAEEDVQSDTDTDNINGVEIGKTEEAGLEVDPDFGE